MIFYREEEGQKKAGRDLLAGKITASAAAGLAEGGGTVGPNGPLRREDIIADESDPMTIAFRAGKISFAEFLGFSEDDPYAKFVTLESERKKP